MTKQKTNPHTGYTPPKVWTKDGDDGGEFASMNRPTAGARHEQKLPMGNIEQNPLQLYSLNTPNGVKVNILLEELSQLGIAEAKYDAYKIDIMAGDQFGSDFVSINPNSKIPALVDHTNPDSPVQIFESGAIMMYLAEKFDKFIPASTNSQKRASCLSWVMWQMGSAPYLGGGFGHFYAYAPYPMQYPIDRFSMEAKRQLDVLDKKLQTSEYLCGDNEDNYTIADMIVWAWYGQLVLDKLYDGAAQFLQVDTYSHVLRWAKQIQKRPAVQKAVDLTLQPIDV